MSRSEWMMPWGRGYAEGVAFLRCWGGSPRGSPQTRSRKGETEAAAHTQEQLDAPDVFIEGRAQHDSRRHADRVTGPWPRLASDTQEGAALEKDQHQDQRQGRRGGLGVRRGSRGRGRGQGRRGHPASAIARILWPPARKYSIATGLHSPEASPSQTPEPGGQAGPFPACLPGSIIENKRTRETEKPKIKKTQNAPSVKDTGKGGQG